MNEELAIAIPYIIIGLFALAFVLFLVALQQLHVGRRGMYWRIRKEAGQRGGQLFLLSVTLFAIATAAAFFTGFTAVAVGGIGSLLNLRRDDDELYGVVVPTVTNTAEPTRVVAAVTEVVVIVAPEATGELAGLPDPTATATATETPVPTATVTLPPSITPTVTATATVTPTASPTFEVSINQLAPEPYQRPRTDAALQVIAADTAVSANQTPTRSTTSFEAGSERIYLFISFENMDNGVRWSRTLYRDGVPIQGSTLLWSLGEEGASYFFFGDNEGYASGSYEVRLRLDDQEVSTFAFTVQ